MFQTQVQIHHFIDIHGKIHPFGTSAWPLEAILDLGFQDLFHTTPDGKEGELDQGLKHRAWWDFWLQPPHLQDIDLGPDFFPLTNRYTEKMFWPFILIHKQWLLFCGAQFKAREKTLHTSDPLWVGSALYKCPLLSWPFMWLLRLYWVLNVFSQPLLGQKKGRSPARMTSSVNLTVNSFHWVKTPTIP